MGNFCCVDKRDKINHNNGNIPCFDQTYESARTRGKTEINSSKFKIIDIETTEFTQSESRLGNSDKSIASELCKDINSISKKSISAKDKRSYYSRNNQVSVNNIIADEYSNKKPKYVIGMKDLIKGSKDPNNSSYTRMVAMVKSRTITEQTARDKTLNEIRDI